MEFVFWCCAGFVVYAYFGYPVILATLARWFSRPVARADVTPFVSFIITVHNEEKRIGAKLENTLELDYPRDRLEIIVASDCSSDGTHRIVEQYREKGVCLIVAPERRGKEFAQSSAIGATVGEILVFSDVATQLDRRALRAIVANFADSSVGCVSSVDKMIGEEGQPGGEGAYVRYEMWLRALESRLGSVVGLSGSFFAARRAVCSPWAVDLPSDFTTLLNSLRRGLRGISDPDSVGYYPDLADRKDEYARKVRTIGRGIVALKRNLEALNPFQYGLAAWQIFSHKLCRWLVPVALLGLIGANIALIERSSFYAAVAVGQGAAYAMAVVGMRNPDRLGRLGRIMTFFVIANLSILHAWFNVFRGKHVVVWEPSRR